MLNNRQEKNNSSNIRKVFVSFLTFFLFFGFLFLNSVFGENDCNSNNLALRNGFLNNNSYYKFSVYYHHGASNIAHVKSVYTSSSFESHRKTTFAGTPRKFNTSIKVIPNPIKTTQFKIKSSSPIVRVEIITILGSRIYLKEKANASGVINVNMNQKRQGVYLVRVKLQNGKEKVKKVIFK